MTDVREKKQDPSPKVKDIMSGFESGTVQNGATKYSAEKPIARPGGAKKLAQAFEKKSEPTPGPDISRKTPKTPTSPAPQSPPVPATSDEKPPPQEDPKQPTATSSKPADATPADAPPPAQTQPKAQTSSPEKTAATPKQQNVLIVYADMEKAGFNGEVLDATVKALKAQGHTVEVSDLYRNKFNPLPTRLDAGIKESGGNFLYEESMLTANISNKVSADIKAEQDMIRKADLVIFLFRFLPSGIPAMLQGYLNRVLSEGFGADFTSKAMFDQGKLKGKKAVLCMSCLLNAENFSKKSAFGELDGYLYPVQNGTLRYNGFDVLAPQMNDDYFYGGDIQQKSLLDSWNKRLANIFTEKAISLA